MGVLNAFRHQRESRSFSWRVVFFNLRCSTPFGIKGNRAVGGQRDRHAVDRVLNAFRHQRESRDPRARQVQEAVVKCSTPFGIKGNRASWNGENVLFCRVLNAFRHQRESRAPRGRYSSPAARCSTPFGIKGNRARGRLTREPIRLVLNAFRHQRESRIATVSATGVEVKCSTPFGIKGNRARASPWPCLSTRSAQRLSASKGIALACRRKVAADHKVLNAFRHQRESRAPVVPRRSRLLLVLNAFRHQRESRRP